MALCHSCCGTRIGIVVRPGLAVPPYCLKGNERRVIGFLTLEKLPETQRRARIRSTGVELSRFSSRRRQLYKAWTTEGQVHANIESQARFLGLRRCSRLRNTL